MNTKAAKRKLLEKAALHCKSTLSGFRTRKVLFKYVAIKITTVFFLYVQFHMRRGQTGSYAVMNSLDMETLMQEATDKSSQPVLTENA